MLKHMDNGTRIVLSAAIEAVVTGVILFVRPSLFAGLVFGADFSAAGLALGRLTAIALLGLALATWPVQAPSSHLTLSVRALLTYNVLAAIYLVHVSIDEQLTGVLLWPAVALHTIFSILLAGAWLGGRNQASRKARAWHD